MRGKRRTVGIISASGSPHATAIADALQALGADVRFFDTGHAQAPAPMTLGSTKTSPGISAAFVDILPMAVPRAFMAEGSYWLHHDWGKKTGQARSAGGRCSKHFGGIDFKRDAKGDLHLLECNAQPGWLAIEKATGAPVCDGLARYLLTL